MVSEWLYACVRQMRKPSKHGESKLASNSYVWMLLNSSFAVYLFKYYENTILKEFNIYFFFLRGGFWHFFGEEQKVMFDLKHFQSCFKLMWKCYQLKSGFD